MSNFERHTVWYLRKATSCLRWVWCWGGGEWRPIVAREEKLVGTIISHSYRVYNFVVRMVLSWYRATNNLHIKSVCYHITGGMEIP